MLEILYIRVLSILSKADCRTYLINSAGRCFPLLGGRGYKWGPRLSVKAKKQLLSPFSIPLSPLIFLLKLILHLLLPHALSKLHDKE